MFRRSGYRFADKNMRQSRISRACSDSEGTEYALVSLDSEVRAGACGNLGRTSESGHRRLPMGRQGEAKDGAARFVHGRGNLPAVRVDDRAANCQSHPHAAGFGRVERFEQALEPFRVQSGPGIPYRDAPPGRPVFAAGDQQLARAIALRSHRLDGIEDQIEHDLLQLDAISINAWQPPGKVDLQRDLAPHHLDRKSTRLNS